MENKTDDKFVFEDISSSSPSHKNKIITAQKEYSEGALRHIDKVIKAISFIVALIVAALFFLIAAVLVTLDSSFKVIALAVVVVGVILALIFLFLIYGLGHIITQNKQILRRL